MPVTGWRFLGRVDYRQALAVQEATAALRHHGAATDTLLLLEHPPTITLGRRASENDDVLWPQAELVRRGIETVRVGRGGGATYHGPGQLVGYPIVRLRGGGRSVRRFVEDLEAVLLETAAAFGIAAMRRAERPGIWIDDRKLASIGIEVRRGVTRHGFALNVDMDLTPFCAIVPCRDPGLRMTDLAREGGGRPSLAVVAATLVTAWQRRIGPIAEELCDESQRAG